MRTPHHLCSILLVSASIIALAGCASTKANGGDGPPGSSGRIAALHQAADCLRQHGITNFHDPVLGANGQVFTDARPLQSASDGVLRAAQSACRSRLSAADWNLKQEPPAPAALVAAGVKAAQCLRQHGMPNYRDPTAASEYTPGHGFGISQDEMPPGADKTNPTVQQAFSACRSLLDAENAASNLSNLSGH
jgi:hypothetical protein